MRMRNLFGLVAMLVVIALVCRPANAQATWTDPATGLMWEAQQGQQYMIWNQATNYCAGLRLGGYSNWRLPTISELMTLYDAAQSKPEYFHTKTGIHLISGGDSLWSSTRTTDPGQVEIYMFSLGMRTSWEITDTSVAGALCMRRP